MFSDARNKLAGVDRVLSILWTVVMVVAVAIMMLCALTQVIMRVGWGGSWAPFTEIIAYAFTFATFSGAALLFRGRHHLAIDFFVDRLPQRARGAAAGISDGLVVATCLWLAFLSIDMVRGGAGQFSPALGFPLAWIYAVVPLSLISCVFFVAVHGFRARSADDEPGQDERDEEGLELA